LSAAVVFAGPAKKTSAPPKAKSGTTETQSTEDWQARLSTKVLEWAGQTDLDYGFTIAYWRDPNHPSSVVGPFEDGRSVFSDPNAFMTLPSQSHLNLGLRIFLDQMYANNGSLDAVLQALEQRGDVKMLAEPTLTVRKGGAEANAVTGSRIPYSSAQVAGTGLAEVTLFQDTGVSLKVKFLDVVKLDDLYAKMHVSADVSSLAGYVTVSVDSRGNSHRVPQTNSRHIESTVLVRNNTTLIAGVLKEDSKMSNAQGPPILGDIPIIKYLFRNRSSAVKTHEILFLIHVELIPPGAL